MGPRRIQRKRTKGWRMPEGAVYVGRPTKWGNPFWHAQKFYGVEKALALFRNTANGAWDPGLTADFADGGDIAYRDHRAWILGMWTHPVSVARIELRGRDLACWCSLDAPCHADVLLEIANQELRDATEEGKP